MATPVPTLVGGIRENASDGTILVPNTTPPAVGDYMVAFIALYASGSSRSINTPSGWTVRQSQAGDAHPVAMFTRVADAGDVGASNFTFTATGTGDVMTGAIIKVTNVATGLEIAGSEYDTTDSATTSITPGTAESLALFMLSNAENLSVSPTVSGYASTPSLTWTERYDQGGNNGTPSMSFGVATAPISGTSTITNRSAASSDSVDASPRNLFIVLNGQQDATGTNALLEVSPTFFSQNGQAGTTGSNALHTAEPTFFDQSGTGTSPGAWSNDPKPSTVWTNPDKL